MNTAPRNTLDATPRRAVVARAASAPRIVERGALRFRVYTQKRDKYVSHTLAYRLNGRRHRIVRAQMADIERAVDTAETAIVNSQTALLDFTEADRSLLQRLRELAAPAASVPLEILVAEAVEARRQNSRAKIVPKHCPQIVEEYLATRKLGSKWARVLGKMLERVAAQFTGPLTAYTPLDFRNFLDTLAVTPRTRKNYRDALAAVLDYARGKYVPADFDPLAGVPNPEPPAAAVNLYTPDELIRLLTVAESSKAGRKLVPLIAITAFAGVRHGEMNEEKVEHLDWSNVRWKTKRIFVPDAVAKRTRRKTGNARVVDMPANLIAWLQPYAQTTGRICELANTSSALCRLRKKAGITGDKRNALRKSFISYKKALTSDIAGVADAAGNSAAVIRRNYLHVDEEMKETAERWFNIMPQRADVLPLFDWAREAVSR